MRSTAAGLATLALAAASPAAGQGDLSTASVPVRSTPGGGIAWFGSPTEAQAACTGAGGGFGLDSARHFICANPRTPLRSTRAAAAPHAPAAPVAPPADADADQVAPGIEVESVTLRPGESASFTLAKGFSHQLLRRADPAASGAITVRYETVGGGSRIVATSRTGYALTFSVLADPDGNGGFSPMGRMSLPGDGTPAARSWPGPLGSISVGSFAGGPD